MRAILLFGLFVLSFISFLLVGVEKAYAWSFSKNEPSATVSISSKVVTDSLVRNLSCRKIGVNAIYAAIREDAFDQKRNMPIQNWSFSSGGFPIAGCWALSSTQRMFSYMTRYNEAQAHGSYDRTFAVLNMVRRSDPDEASSNEYPGRPGENLQTQQLREGPAKVAVFKVAEDSLSDDYRYGRQGLWTDLMVGLNQRFPGGSFLHRNFRGDVQVNQAYHFFRVGNIGMAVGSGSRGEGRNAETAAQLVRNISGKRLTLVNLRVNQTNQHVVMVKSFTKDSSGNILFKVYDSNQFRADQNLIYSSKYQQFYAPDVMGAFGGTGSLGAFIVSEDERGPLENALVEYYKQACR
ncbi:MAG TPA: hypothetical protein VF412_16300 [Bdellovibrio sp.]|uniref:hypothetical protein n=1 Tax=Bdellovibrio sp. TaxID=28201 RepID=UPI002F0A61A7